MKEYNWIAFAYFWIAVGCFAAAVWTDSEVLAIVGLASLLRSNHYEANP